MPNDPTDAYCDAVCRLVRYPFARGAIRAELTAHMEDRAAALADAGESPEEAARRAVKAMGDPEETGRAMNKVYPPVLSFSVAVTRLMTLVLAGILLLLIIPHVLTSVWNLVRGPSLPADAEIVRSVQPNAVLRAGNTVFIVSDVTQTAEGTLHVAYRGIFLGLNVSDYSPSTLQVLDDSGTVYMCGWYTSSGLISFSLKSANDYPLTAPTVTLRFEGEAHPGEVTVFLGEVNGA